MRSSDSLKTNPNHIIEILALTIIKTLYNIAHVSTHKNTGKTMASLKKKCHLYSGNYREF